MVSAEKGQNIIVAEMFIMFVIFWAIQIYYFFMWGFGEQDEVGIASLPAPILGGVGKWNNIDFRRDFSFFFSAHVACSVLAVLYAPFVFCMVMAWLHLGAFLGLIIAIFLACAPFMLRVPSMAGLNITLLVAGLIQVGKLPVV